MNLLSKGVAYLCGCFAFCVTFNAPRRSAADAEKCSVKLRQIENLPVLWFDYTMPGTPPFDVPLQECSY